MDKNNYAVPIAIVVAGILIAGAIFYNNQTPKTTEEFPEVNLELADPITESDHLIGNESSNITIVEYSDLNCPYCRRFHETGKEILEKYPISLVFRHFVIFGENSLLKAEATECAAELGGKEKFSEYLDLVYTTQDSQTETGVDDLVRLATDIGISDVDFRSCLDSDRHITKIEKDSQNAVDIGATGTPFNFIIKPDGTKEELGGAVPSEILSQIIEEINQ